MAANFNVQVAIDSSGVVSGSQQAARALDDFTRSSQEYRKEAQSAESSTTAWSSASRANSEALSQELAALRQYNIGLVEMYNAARQGIEAVEQLTASREVAAEMATIGADAETRLGAAILQQILIRRDLSVEVDRAIANARAVDEAEGNITGIELRVAALREQLVAYRAGAEAAAAYEAGVSIGSYVSASGAVTEEQIARVRALAMEERTLSEQIAETKVAMEQADMVAANISAIEERNAALREQLVEYKQGSAAAEQYAEISSVNSQARATGATSEIDLARAREQLDMQVMLRQAIQETAAAQKQSDAVAANVAGIRERTAALREQLEQYKLGAYAAKLYDEQTAASTAVVGAGATVGSPQATAIEENVILQRKLQEEIDKTGRAAEDTAQRGTEAFNSFGSAVKIVVLYALVYALGEAAASTVKLEVQFEESMTKMKTLVNVPADQVDAFREKIEQFALETGRMPDELAKAMFVVTSDGERGQQALETLHASAKAASVGLGDMATIARVAVGAVQAYGHENLTAAQAVNGLIGGVREGNMQIEQLAGALGRVLPLAAEFGVNFAQVNAAVATFTRLGVDASTATTGLRAIFTNLLQDSSGAGAKMLERFGTSAAEVKKEIVDKGLMQALTDLVARFNGNDEALRKVFPNVRALVEVLSNAKDQSAAYAVILANINATMDTAVDKAFALRNALPIADFDKMKVAVAEFGMAIGGGLIPALDASSKYLFELFSNNKDKAVEFGREVGQVIGALVQSLKFLIDHWTQLKSAIELIIGIKIAIWFEMLVNGSSLSILNLVKLGDGFAASSVLAGRLIATDVAGAMARWVLSINAVYAGLILLGVALNNVIDDWKRSMDAATAGMIRMQSTRDALTDLKSALSEGFITQSTIAEVQDASYRIKQDVDEIKKKYEEASAAASKTIDYKEMANIAHQQGISIAEATNAQNKLLSDAQEELRVRLQEGQAREKMFDQLIAKAKLLKVVDDSQQSDPKVKPAGALPPDAPKFDKTAASVSNLINEARALADAEVFSAKTVGALTLSVENQGNVFKNALSTQVQLIAFTADHAKQLELLDAASKNAVAAGEAEAVTQQQLREAHAAVTTAITKAKEQKEIDAAVTKIEAQASKMSADALAEKILKTKEDLVAQQEANEVRQHTTESIKFAEQAIKDSEPSLLVLITGLNDLTNSQRSLDKAISQGKLDELKASLQSTKLPANQLTQALRDISEQGLQKVFSNVTPASWVQALHDAAAKIGELKAALSQLTPGSAQYNEVQKALAAAQTAFNDAVEKTPELLRKVQIENDKPAQVSIDKVNEEIAAIHGKTIAIGEGAVALKQYEAQQQLVTQATQIASQVTRQSGEDDISLANRKAQAFAESYAALSEQLAATNKAAIFQPFYDFLNNVPQLFSDAFKRMVEGNGPRTFKNFIEDLFTSIYRGIADMLLRWLQAELQMRLAAVATAEVQAAVSSGSASPGGVSLGGVATNMATNSAVDAGSSAIGGAAATTGGGSLLTTAVVGNPMVGGFGGSIFGGGLGALAAVFAWVAVIAAVVAVVANWVGSHQSTRAQVDVAERDGKFVTENLRGAKEMTGRLMDAADGLTKSLNDYLDSLNLQVDKFVGKLGITRSGRNTSNEFRVYYTDSLGNQMVTNFYRDADAALQDAFYRALANSDLSMKSGQMPLDPMVVDAIKGAAQIAADSMFSGMSDAEKQAVKDAFNKAISNAQEVSSMGKPQFVANERQQVQHYDDLRASMLSVLKTGDQLTQAFNNINASELQMWQNVRNQLTGQQETRQQQLQDAQNNAKVFNAEKKLRELAIQQAIDDLEVQKANINGHIVGTRATLEYTGAFLRSLDLMDRGVIGFAGSVVASTGLLSDFQQKQLDSINEQEKALQDLLNGLKGIKDINPGEVHLGGAGGQSATDRAKQISDVRRQLDEGGMTSAEQQFAQLVDNFNSVKESIKQLHLSTTQTAEMMEQAAKNEAKAMALLKQQMMLDVKKFIDDGLNPLGASVYDAITGIQANAKQARQSILAMLKAGQITEAEYHALLGGINESTGAQIKKQVDDVIKSFNQFVDAGANGGAGIGQLTSQLQGVDDSAAALIAQLDALQKAGKLTADQVGKDSQQIRESAEAQKKFIANQDAMSALQALYNAIGDTVDAKKLEYQLQLAELEAKKAELAIAVKQGLITQDLYDQFSKALDTFVANNGNPTQQYTGPSADDVAHDKSMVAGGGTDAVMTLDQAHKLLLQYQQQGIDQFTQDINKINTDFVQLRAVLGDTVEVQLAYNNAIQTTIDKYFKPLIQLQQSLNQGSSSPLSAEQKYNDALSAFQTAVNQVRGGNFTQLSDIPQLAQTLLAAAQAAMPQGSAAYVNLFNSIQQTLAQLVAQWDAAGHPGGTAPPPVPTQPPPGGTGGQPPAPFPTPFPPQQPGPSVNVDPIVQQLIINNMNEVAELRAIRFAQESSRDTLQNIYLQMQRGNGMTTRLS